MKPPIAVALDTPDLGTAVGWASAVAPSVRCLKIGLELYLREGARAVHEIRAAGGDAELFLDLKLHDIPNTVAKSIQALSPITPAVLTVHAAGGRAMLEDAKAAAPAGTRVVAVTVLTSLDGDDLTSIGVNGDSHSQVERLAGLAREAGLDGIVCSGNEVAAAHKKWRDGFFVVPGIRPLNSHTADQKRVMTPRGAIDAGASILVIGRPVTGAEDPGMALREIAGTL